VFAVAVTLLAAAVPATADAAVTDLDTSFGTHPSQASTWFANGGAMNQHTGRGGIFLGQQSESVVVGGELSPTPSSGSADQLERLTSAGLPDTSFGAGGVDGPPSMGGASFSYYNLDSLLVLADGSIETMADATPAGTTNPVIVFAHYTSGGILDTLVTTPGGPNGGGMDMAQQPNGGIVAVNGGTLYRLTTSHQLDSGFGTGGIETTGWSFTSIAAQSTNQIIAGGTLDGSTGTQGVVAFDGATGAVNNSFGAGNYYPGQTKTTFGQAGFEISITGVRIVGSDEIALGAVSSPSSSSSAGTLDFALLTSNGHFDGAFGPGSQGYATEALNQTGWVSGGGFSVDPNGNLILACSLGNAFYQHPVLGGVTSTGAVDIGISATGYTISGLNGAYNALLTSSSKKYLVGGWRSGWVSSSSFVTRLVGESGATPLTLTNLQFNIADGGIPQFVYYMELRHGAPAPTAADWDAESTATTTPGQATIPVLPGDTVYFNRTATPAAPPGPGPEGPSGQAFAVAEPVPGATQTVNVPSAGATYSPELSGPEEWIIGELNQQRQSHGVPPLQVSTTLSAAASVQAREEALGFGFPFAYYNVVNQDQGWPGNPSHQYFAVADAPFLDPTRVLTHWNGSTSDPESPAIWQQLGSAYYHLAGIANGDGAWVIEVADACPSVSDAGACGVTSDTGNINAWTPPTSSGGESSSSGSTSSSSGSTSSSSGSTSSSSGTGSTAAATQACTWRLIGSSAKLRGKSAALMLQSTARRTCSATVTISVRLGHRRHGHLVWKTITIGNATYAAAPGQTSTVRVPLSATGLAALVQAHRLTARISCAGSSAKLVLIASSKQRH
jgi:hypothetical protein